MRGGRSPILLLAGLERRRRGRWRHRVTADRHVRGRNGRWYRGGCRRHWRPVGRRVRRVARWRWRSWRVPRRHLAGIGLSTRRIWLLRCRKGWRRSRILRRSGRLRRLRRRSRQPAARVGADDGAVPATERIAGTAFVVHRRSSRIAHSSSSRSGQSPEKCMPIEPAVENSGHSGDFRSR